MSEYVETVEATGQESKQLNPIAAVLKGKKGSALEHLVKSCNCTINKQRGYITDVAGNVILISQLFEWHGINTTGPVRCPKCFEPVSWNLLLYHFDDHNMKIDKIYDVFKRNFYQWSFYDMKFTYLGSDIEF